MKRSVLLFAVILLASCATVRPQKYFTMDEMPDLVKCLPAPPAPGTPEFRYDSLRYFWGKEQRKDPVRAAIADRDAGWQIDTVIAVFSGPFGMKLSPDGTPEIWHLLYSGIKTMEQIRVRPKAYFHRQRPFEYFNDHVLTLWEEEELRGEGSYPSGHTIRGWAMALMLAEVNPDAAEALFAKGWEYGESRVIVGAHWQSDVDASRAAASIAYAKAQTSKAFRRQVARARAEYLRLK
jgi:acid phosphatase (class A)